MFIINITSSSREEIIDITAHVKQALREYDCEAGAALLFCRHTTCGLTINEGADPDVKRDLMRFFNEVAPQKHQWLHREGNTDAHIRSSLLGVSLMIPVLDFQPMLGTWQSIYLYEGDGPRTRQIILTFMPGR